MKLSRGIFTAALAFVFCANSFSLEVDEKELETVSTQPVVFENYNGPHSVINSAAEIAEIGTDLGKIIADNPETPKNAGSSLRYQIIHAVNPEEKGKFDADIFVIGSSSSIDHIKNIRRIIAAYLSKAYGYSSDDAQTVATFVTVYNAVYRGNTDYFNLKYKKIVTDNLTAEKAGIALNYRDWPGKTQIVIPLADVNGGLSTVDTSVISDKKVVQSMQEDEDKGVYSRKQMVNIKEREADKAQEKANDAQKKAVEESSKLKEEQKKAETAKTEAQNAQKEAEQAQKKAEENPEDKQAQKEAEEKRQEAEQKQEEAVQQEQKVQEQSEKTQEAKNEAAQAQAAADTKRTEAQTERTSIAQDQQTIVREQTKNQNATGVYGLKSVDDLGILSTLVKVNAETGSVIKESPVTVIRSRTIFETQAGYIAIAGTSLGNGAVKLVVLDKENMEIVKESNENIAENSVLVSDGSNYYCIIQDGKNFVTGKFNENAENLLKSQVNVKPATPLTITQNGILATSSSNILVLLNTKDLSQIKN